MIIMMKTGSTFCQMRQMQAPILKKKLMPNENLSDIEGKNENTISDNRATKGQME